MAQGLDRFFLFWRKAAQTPAHTIELRLANGLKMILQRYDGRHHMQALEPGLEARDLGFDDSLSTFGLALAILNVSGDGFLKVVNVIDKDAVEFVHLRRNISGHGNIDEEHGAIFSTGEEFFPMLTAEDGNGGSG